MLMTVSTRKPACLLARGGMRVRLCVRPDAFGNALGGAFVDSMRPSYSRAEMLGDYQREANRFASAGQSSGGGGGDQFGQLGSGTYGLDEDLNLVDRKGNDLLTGSVIQPVTPSKGAYYLPTLDGTGSPILNSDGSPNQQPFQTVSAGVYDFTEAIRDGGRYRTWGNYPANVSLRSEDGQDVLRNVYSTYGVAPSDAMDGSASYSQAQLKDRLIQMAANRVDLDEMRSLARVVNPNSPWLQVPDMGRVIGGGAAFVGTGVAGMLTGGAFFTAARTGGFGLTASGMGAGFYGNLTTQIANNGIGFATNGRYGQQGINPTELALSGALGAVPGLAVNAWKGTSKLGNWASNYQELGTVKFGAMARTSGESGALVQPSLWESRLPGVQVRQIGDWWVKRVDPGANSLMQSWGKSSIEAQYSGLQNLREMATESSMRNGVLFTRDVGATLPDGLRLLNATSRSAYTEGSLRMGTFFNDIQPRNMGLNGLIFDPAIDPVTKGVFSIGAGTAVVGGGYAGYKLSGGK